MHRPRRGKAVHGRAEPGAGSQSGRVQLRVSARQPAAVGAVIWPLIRQRREGQDRGPRPPPRLQHMRIDEAEGRIAGQRDPPAGGRQRSGRRRLGQGAMGGGRDDRLQVAMRRDEIARMVQDGLQARRLLGLDQAQMALGQGDVALPRQAAQHADARLIHPLADQPVMARRGHAVQHHPRKGQIRAQRGKAPRRGRRRLRLPADIQDQHHRPAHHLGDLGAGADAGFPLRRDPVEQAHRPLGQDQVGGRLAGRMGDQPPRLHRPGIQVEAGPPRGRQVEPRIDVVGPRLEGLHHQPAPAQRGQQAQHQHRLAGPRCGGRDHQARRQGARHSGNLGASPTGR